MVNWCKSCPDSATSTQAKFSNTPTPMMLSTPKRWIKCPVTKPGANIPITCHCKTIAASLNSKPQTCIASGVAAISKFITP